MRICRDEKSANKRLHEKGLGPVPSDLLYSHCQIRLSAKYFSSAFNQSGEVVGNGSPSNTSLIRCQSCQTILGDHSEKDDFVQFWHHTVILNEKVRPSNALETFLLLIGGICAEHDWLPLKIRLKSNNLTAQ